MADKRVIEEPSSTELYSDDWFLKDSATHGTRKILVSRLKELLCGDYIADEWVAGETYTNGAIVSHEGKLYYNKSGGTLVHTTFNSNSWLEVKIDELLEKVISSVGEKWRRVDTYHYDDLVVYGGRLYRCIKNASTQGTWVSNEWIEANAEYYFKKVREYIARYGFVPSREAVSSPYNKGDLILYRAPGDTTNNLYMRLNDTENGDPTWIPENWLKVGNIGGALSKIYDDMEESSCDVQIKEQSIIDENKVADLTSLAMVGSASEAIASFDDGSALPMPKLEVAIEPQQDLHGYDHPWVGGAGKNLIPMTVDGIKALNTNQQWIGNTYTINGVTFTIETDSDENVIGINVNGTSTGWTALNLGEITLPIGTYTLSTVSPIPSSGIYLTHNPIGFVEVWTNAKTATISTEQNAPVYIGVDSGNSLSNYTFKPMIEEGSTATAFEPYSNICPISGWDEVNVTVCGNNLLASSTLVSNTYINQNTGEEIPYNGWTSTDYIPINTNKWYRLLKLVDGSYEVNAGATVYWACYDSNLNFVRGSVGDGMKDFPSNAKWLRTSSQTALMNKAVLCEDSDVSSFTTESDYIDGTAYTVEFKDGDNPLTVYGGTLDVVSGVLTVDRAYVDLGSLSWSYDATIRRFSATVQDKKMPTTTRGESMLCSCFIVIDDGRGIAELPNGCVYSSAGSLSIYIHDNRYSDASTFKTSVTGQTLVYELANPITYQLTPTQVKSLLGVNNIWADTGDVLDAEYIRDATTIINSLIARIEALENQ